METAKLMRKKVFLVGQTDTIIVIMGFFCVADLQQQIHDHHPDASDRMCSAENAHLSVSEDFLRHQETHYCTSSVHFKKRTDL